MPTYMPSPGNLKSGDNNRYNSEHPQDDTHNINHNNNHNNYNGTQNNMDGNSGSDWTLPKFEDILRKDMILCLLWGIKDSVKLFSLLHLVGYYINLSILN